MRRIKVTCIVCPIGCEIWVTIRGDSIKVEGNACPRGEAYAIKEATNPQRILMTVVLVEGGHLPTVSIKTTGPIPKKLVRRAIRALARLRLKAPIKRGDIVVRNLLGLGVDVVATRTVHKLQANPR